MDSLVNLKLTKKKMKRDNTTIEKYRLGLWTIEDYYT